MPGAVTAAAEFEKQIPRVGGSRRKSEPEPEPEPDPNDRSSRQPEPDRPQRAWPPPARARVAGSNNHHFKSMGSKGRRALRRVNGSLVRSAWTSTRVADFGDE